MSATREEGAARFTLDQLAAASGVSRRTIRYYQAEHLLPQPTKSGRDAVYVQAHLDRLHQIGELRDRGLTLHTIRQLLSSDSPPRTVSEWLGIDATLSAPWSDDRPRIVSRDELTDLLRRHGPVPRGFIGDLTEHAYVAPQPDGTWRIPSPALLEQAVQLHHGGIDVEISAAMRDLLRRRIARSVDDIVELVRDRIGSGFARTGSPEDIARAIDALRPVTRETAGIILTREVERALGDLARAGPRRSRSSRR